MIVNTSLLLPCAVHTQIENTKKMVPVREGDILTCHPEKTLLAEAALAEVNNVFDR